VSLPPSRLGRRNERRPFAWLEKPHCNRLARPQQARPVADDVKKSVQKRFGVGWACRLVPEVACRRRRWCVRGSGRWERRRRGHRRRGGFLRGAGRRMAPPPRLRIRSDRAGAGLRQDGGLPGRQRRHAARNAGLRRLGARRRSSAAGRQPSAGPSPARTSRTLRSRRSGVKGFWRKGTLPSSPPC